MKIYLIGSLANRKIIELAKKIRDQGHDCFDDWIGPGEEADEKFNQYRKRRGLNYKEALASHAAQHIFHFDKKHLDAADVVILVMPAGKSGHLELGYCIGKGKPGYILLDGEPERVDIMHSFAKEIFLNEQELFDTLSALKRYEIAPPPVEKHYTPPENLMYSDAPTTITRDWFDRMYGDTYKQNPYYGMNLYLDPLPYNYQKHGYYTGNGTWIYYK